MSVKELNRDQKTELKQAYYSQKDDESMSYWELANIDLLVSDEELYDEFEGVSFTEDDFFCTAS